MSKLFGEYIRARREALSEGNAAFSIRKVARRIGIHHSYLSKIERGEPASLSEKRVVALAAELDADPDLLLAMSGRVSEDVRRAVFVAPEQFVKAIDDFKVLADSLDQ